MPPSGGRGSRNRTYNLRFWRPTLCQLSYTPPRQLLDDGSDHAGAHSLATFTDGETQTFFHGDGVDQLHSDRHVVARHDHFLVLRQLDGAGHVGRAEVELRTVVVEERGVRLDAARLAQHLAALDVFTLGTAQQDADVVASLTLVQQLAEHFHAGAGGLDGGLDTHDFDFFADLDDAALNTTGHHSAATRDREHVFHRHQEGTVHSALRRGDVGVQGFGQLHDGLLAQLALVAVQRQTCRTLDDRGVVAREFVLGQQLAHFHFNQFQQLSVVHQVSLVQEDDDVRHAHLAGQQDVFTGLGHRAVSSRAHQDSAVHLSGASDHVLHIVSVAGAVHVSVVAVGGFVLNVSGVDGDTAGLFFGRCVDLVVSLGFAAELGCQNGSDRSRQGGLAVVNVTDGADVHVRLGTFKLAFCHFFDSEKKYLNQHNKGQSAP